MNTPILNKWCFKLGHTPLKNCSLLKKTECFYLLPLNTYHERERGANESEQDKEGKETSEFGGEREGREASEIEIERER